MLAIVPHYNPNHYYYVDIRMRAGRISTDFYFSQPRMPDKITLPQFIELLQ